MRLEIQSPEVALSPQLVACIESKFTSVRRRFSRKVLAIHVFLRRGTFKQRPSCLLVVQLRRRRQWVFQAACDDLFSAVEGAWQCLHNEPRLIPLALPAGKRP